MGIHPTKYQQQLRGSRSCIKPLEHRLTCPCLLFVERLPPAQVRSPRRTRITRPFPERIIHLIPEIQTGRPTICPLLLLPASVVPLELSTSRLWCLHFFGFRPLPVLPYPDTYSAASALPFTFSEARISAQRSSSSVPWNHPTMTRIPLVERISYAARVDLSYLVLHPCQAWALCVAAYLVPMHRPPVCYSTLL